MPQPNKQRRYKTLKRLGGGGMATVFLAKDRRLRRDVAIKVLPEEEETDLEAEKKRAFLFHREARAIAALRHEGIVQIFDYTGPEESPSYIVMEFIRGLDLESLQEKGLKAPTHVVLCMLHSLSAALSHCHERGVIHRDLKPANIMLEPATGRVILMDFGIAKSISLDGGLGPTSVRTRSELIGTPEFLSPEQILDNPIGAGVDVFAFGSLAYTLLTGSSPFWADSTVDILRNIIDVLYAPATDLLPELPPEINDFLNRALESTPEDRATIDELHETLGKFLANQGIFNSRIPIRNWLAEEGLVTRPRA